MNGAFKAAAGTFAVVALAGGLAAGSQLVRSHPMLSAADLASKSATPIADCQFAVDHMTCGTPTPACVPGEGVECPGPVLVAPAQPASPEPQPTDAPPGTTGPQGQIQVSASSFVIPGSNGNGGKLALEIAVLAGSDWVAGAQVSARCSGPGFDQSASGVTAPRGSWPATANPGVPTGGPATFFWSVMTGNLEEGTGKYACHGSASYNGLSATF